MEELKCELQLNDICYITIEKSAELCGMSYGNFHNHIEKFNVIRFANVVFLDYDEVIKFRNHRQYQFKLKEIEKSNKKGSSDDK